MTHTDDVVRQQELEQSWIKLLALAGALDDLPAGRLAHRVVETAQERMKLIRVWDARVQGPSETIACLKHPKGWRYWIYPHGPIIADADGIEEPDQPQTVAAAHVVSAHTLRLTR